MEKLGFFQSNLFTSFQKNVYIILWKKSGKWLLSPELRLRQRLQNFYDNNFQASKSNDSQQKKETARPMNTCIKKKKKYTGMYSLSVLQSISGGAITGIRRLCDLCDWHVKHYLLQDKCLATEQ